MALLAAIETDRGSENVVQTASELATGLGRELIVVHVVSGSGDRERARGNIEEIVENALGDSEAADIRIVDEGGDFAELPSGRVADAILRVADSTDATYIVVGSHMRTPVGKVMLGSVAQTVLLNAEVPVVTVEQPNES